MAADSHGNNLLGPWGGPGGDPFRFVAPPGSQIKQIIVHHGGCINSLSFKDINGVEYGPFGGNDPNDPGREAKVEIDGNLISITGTYGNYKYNEVIRSLSFTTDRTTYGPFGNATGGTSFSSTPIEGWVVIGFHGSAGFFLDSIGLFVIPTNTI